MSRYRRCSRPGCGKPAVATLTYAYAESTAVVGPLAPAAEPHSWDLCANHAERITAPLGWEMLRVDHIEDDDDDDLTALANAVREAGRTTSGLSDDYREADPEVPQHPIYRPKRVEEHKTIRRGHLRLVQDDEG
ncbi:hypothetical protein COCCU_03335 [Corynebacterium occultum]|uniref:DUF3499 domain-containing protein n=1 Tax=Corynebacterium occultum TaxID=2675219 RepID=A0A6B8W2B3_9CORY|nr:DUF3499 domain-containing protein [Corynebacterium occultum]QGU06621.1 hypothetical protein COCCU_03335 [Corynebacterium occultum]